jgi:hypothetical protein
MRREAGEVKGQSAFDLFLITKVNGVCFYAGNDLLFCCVLWQNDTDLAAFLLQMNRDISCIGSAPRPHQRKMVNNQNSHFNLFLSIGALLGLT